MNPEFKLISTIVLTALVFTPLASGAPGTASADPDLKPQNVSASAFNAPNNYIVHGAHISPVSIGNGAPHEYYTEISNFEAAYGSGGVGKGVGIVMYFLTWDYDCDNGYLPRYADPGAPAVPGVNNGRAIMITWEPMRSSYSAFNPGPADYDNILNGSYDAYITNCANQLKAWSNKTFLMRFMHEMNITDSPWYAGHPYNQKGDGTGDTAKFIQVWRYVHNKFVAAGATNVQWLWAPNWDSNPDVPWNDMHNYYPGDAYVDWIGLSGYNWMAYKGYPAPQTYSDLYDAALTDLQCRYAKPIVHNEIGSVQYISATFPTNKQDWITDTYQRMQTYPLVRAVTWFNDYAYHNTDQADFRVWTNTNFHYLGSSPFTSVPNSIRSAYAIAVSDPSFTSTFDSSQLLNPPMTRCPSDSLSNDGVLGVRPAASIVGKTGATTTSFMVGALGLGSNTTFTVSGCPSGVTCSFASTNTSTSGTFTTPWDADTLSITASSSAALGIFTLTISNGAGTSTTVQLTVAQSVSRIYLPLIQK